MNMKHLDRLNPTDEDITATPDRLCGFVLSDEPAEVEIDGDIRAAIDEAHEEEEF